MSRVECPCEQEVLDAIASCRWPDRMDEDLSNHIAGCVLCSDLAPVADALKADFSAAIARARVPSPGLVWWKAEIRLRQESIRKASRPISLASYTAVAFAAIVVVALLKFFDFGILQNFSLGSLMLASFPISLLVGAVCGLGAVASLVLYFVLSDNK